MDDAATGLSIDVTLESTRDVAAELAAGYAVYRRGHDSGATILHRPSPSGVEDYLSFEHRPAAPAITYIVGLRAGVGGLRQVENTLEFLDAQGAPRLRVEPPFIVGADGQTRQAGLAIDGCDVDRNPAGPWDRPVTDPGATRCTLTVSWADEGVTYPALLDPRWTSTTNTMVAARQQHTATLLASGKVLVAGGNSGSAALASAELFDRTTGTWAATNSMTGARQLHTAVLLGSTGNTTTSGKVLVAGGQNGSSLNSAQLYDPAAGTWAAATNLNAARHQHTATVLANGQMLVAGGLNGTSALNTAALYNPASGTGSWTATSTMTSAVKAHTATLLSVPANSALNNAVLVVGGNNGSASVTVAQVFTGASWSTALVTQLPSTREGHQATALANGNVLVTGGKSGSTPMASTLVFNPSSGKGTWTSAGNMATARLQHSATLLSTVVLSSGQVLVAGGSNGSAAVGSTELWNGATTWTAATALPAAVQGHTATLLGNGMVLVAGGGNGTTPVNAGRLYDPSFASVCTTNTQCATGFCVNGVCCDTACNSGCGACNLTGKIGTCSAVSNGTVCRSAAGECDVAETCNGTSLTCPADVKKAANTACTDDGNPCTTDLCNESAAVCQHAAGHAGTVCRAVAGPCDVAESCTGTSTSCPGDAFLPATTSCRAAIGECDLAETCTGASAACPADGKKTANTACTDDGNVCTTDRCDGTNVTCQHAAGNAGTVCRAATGVCDVAETCTGSSTACPADGLAPTTTVCRASAGVCDLAETCTGTSTTCPADVRKAANATCADDGNPCTTDLCNGTVVDCQHAPGNGGAVCRTAAGPCDVAEACTGTSAVCPADAFLSSATVCRPLAGPCDIAAETCTGTSAACPSDSFCSAATVCRAATGPCDLAENCSGSGPACPGDAHVTDGTSCTDGSLCTTSDMCLGGVCQGTPVSCSADQCHVSAACDASTGRCPNLPKLNGTTCDDGNAATQGETCQLGACRAASSYSPVNTVAVDDIGNLGGSYTSAAGINNFNRVTGVSTLANGKNQGFMWDPPGPMGDIGIDQAFPATEVGSDVNDAGKIAGTMDEPDGTHAFRYGEFGLEDLGVGGDGSGAVDIFQYRGSIAHRMNASGQLTGNFTNGGTIHGFRYTDAVGFEDIGSLAGDLTNGFDISDAGTVVGSSWVPGSPHDFTIRRLGHAVMWDDLTRTLVDLNQYVDPALGWVLAAATAISPDGHFIAGAGDRGGVLRAFRLDTTTGVVDEVSGGWPGNTFVSAVNDAGDVVGFGYKDAANSLQRAWFYSDQIGFRDLNDVVDPTAGWTLRSANDINKNGEIVGSGALSGQTHAFRMQRIASPQTACAGKQDGDACDSGRSCRSHNVCRSGVCGGVDPADDVCLRMDGVVDIGNGKMVAIFGYDSDSPTIFPSINQVSLNGLVVTDPQPPPPPWLPKGTHVGIFLPTFQKGQTISWRMNSQVVTACDQDSTPGCTAGAPLPRVTIGSTGYGVRIGTTLVPIQNDLGPYAAPPTNEPTAQTAPTWPTRFKGMLTGSLSVSPTGAAMYSVPITVPPGIGGMAPNLSLAYNSQTNGGIAGLGWDMGGLSMIYRCSYTLPDDGYVGPPRYNRDDGVCIDGKRMFEGLPGQFTAAISDFTQIRKTLFDDHGGPCFTDYDPKVCGKGFGPTPQSFTVTTKSGEIRTYGARTNSRVNLDNDPFWGGSSRATLVWLLDRVVDKWGNYFDLHYNNDAADFLSEGIRVTSIDYTGHLAGNSDTGGAEGDAPPFNHVTFDYDVRQDVRRVRIADGAVDSLPRKYRLTKITTDQAHSTQYLLTYLPDDPTFMLPTRLQKIDYCTGPTSDRSCLQPLEFDWDSGEYQWQETPHIGEVAGGQEASFDLPARIDTFGRYHGTQFFDYNHDGLVDFIVGQGTRRELWVNTGRGWKLNGGFPVNLVDNDGYPLGVRLIDMNGDGQADIVADSASMPVCTTYPPGWICLGNSTGEPHCIPRPEGPVCGDQVKTPAVFLTGDGGWIPKPSFETFALAGGAPNFLTTDTLIDVDGDHLPDLVRTGPGGQQIQILHNTGSTFTPSSLSTTILGAPASDVYVSDLNGDGIVDLVGKNSLLGKWATLPLPATGAGVQFRPIDSDPSIAMASAGAFASGDVDGDGRPDKVIRTNEIYPLHQQVAFSTMGGATTTNHNSGYLATLNYWSPPQANPDPTMGPFESAFFNLIDINADGLVDLVLDHDNLRNPNLSGLGGQVLINTGGDWHDLAGLGSWQPLPPTSMIGTAPNPAGPAGIRVPVVPNHDEWYQQRGATFVDLDGDGVTDLIQASDAVDGTPVRHAWLNKFRPPIITGFPNGLAQKTQASYSVITTADARSGSSPVYKDYRTDDVGVTTKFLSAPVRVVDSLTGESGAGNGTKAKTTYQYEALRESRMNRGPVGFRRVIMHDQGTDYTTATTFSQVYPYAGMPTSVVKYKGTEASGTKLSETITQYCDTVTEVSGQPNCNATGNVYPPSTSVFVYRLSVTDTAYLDSATQTTISEFRYDANGNPSTTTVTSKTSAGESFVKTTTYHYGAANSLTAQMGLPTQTIAESVQALPASADHTAKTHTTDFDYDTINHFVDADGASHDTLALVKEKVELNAGWPIELHTARAYDRFGHAIITTACEDNFSGCQAGATSPVRDGEELYRTSTTSYDPAVFSPGGSGRYASLPYTQKGRFLVESKNAAGHAEYTVFDQQSGALLQKTAPNRVSTCYELDEFGTRTATTEICTPMGAGIRTTTIAYQTGNADDPPLAKVVTVTSPPTGALTLIFSDVFGRTIEKRGRSFDGGFTTAATVYNNQGRVASESSPRILGPTQVFSQTPHYDSLGRIDSITKDLGFIGPASFAQSTRTTTFQGLTLTTEETVAGDAHSHHREETKNALGKLAKVVDAVGTTTTYSYDADGNLTDTNSPGSHHHIGYDTRGRKTSSSDPDTGGWTYEYNGFGDLIAQTDARGARTTMTYDNIGRLRFKTNDDGTAEWAYDVGAGAGKGKLAAVISAPDSRLNNGCDIPYVSTSDGKRTGRYYNYDDVGEISSIIECIDGETFTTQYQYDQFGRRQFIYYPEVADQVLGVEYHYTSLGFLWYVSSINDLLAYWQAKEMNAIGQVTKAITRNGVETSEDRNPSTGWLISSSSVSRSNQDQLIQGWGFEYDEAGNLHRRVRYDGTIDDTDDETFTYDPLDRLKTSTVHEVTSTNDYDIHGNLTLKDGQTYVYTGCGDHPHWICSKGSETFAYDANGNTRRQGSNRLFYYDASNRAYLLQDGGQAAEFIYSADGLRAVQQVSGVGDQNARTIYVGIGATGKSLYERTAHSGIVEHVQFIYAGNAHGGGAFAVRTIIQRGSTFDDPVMHYYHTDHLGSVTTVSDDQGHVVNAAWGGTEGQNSTALGYDPWGARRNPDGRAADPKSYPLPPGHREFTGHETVPLIGIINMNGRFYDPALGRFLSPDSQVPTPGDLQSFNRYSYVQNNPLRYTDPTGFFLESETGGHFDTIVNVTLGIVATVGCAAGGYVGVAVCVGALLVGIIYNAASMRHNGASWDQVAAVTFVTIYFDALTAGIGAEFGAGAGLVAGAASAAASTYFDGVILGNTSNMGWNMLEAAAMSVAWAAFAATVSNAISEASAEEAIGEKRQSGEPLGAEEKKIVEQLKKVKVSDDLSRPAQLTTADRIKVDAMIADGRVDQAIEYLHQHYHTKLGGNVAAIPEDGKYSNGEISIGKTGYSWKGRVNAEQLYATLDHENVHAVQDVKGRLGIGQTHELNEVEAYIHDLQNAGKYGLNRAQINDLEIRLYDHFRLLRHPDLVWSGQWKPSQ